MQKHHTPVDSHNQSLKKDIKVSAERVPECVVYHLGHLKTKAMLHKNQFYLNRDGETQENLMRKMVWETWGGDECTTPDGRVERISWELPDIVKKALRSE